MHSFWHNDVNIHYNSDYSGVITVSTPRRGDFEVLFIELLEAACDEDQTVWSIREIDAIERFVGDAAIRTEIERLEKLPPDRALEDSNLVWSLLQKVNNLTS